MILSRIGYLHSITRPDSNTCLDLIITSCDIIKDQGICDINISDHLPTYCIRKKCKVHRDKIDFNGRSYKGLDEIRLANMFK